MIALLIFASAIGLSSGLNGYCQSDVTTACSTSGLPHMLSCNARYGEIGAVEYDLQSFVNKHVIHSFQYLLMSSHFNNYERNREGFGKLYRHLSDEAWKNAIELVKYLTKRGGRMDFKNVRQEDVLLRRAVANSDTYELHELESLAKALDIQKSIAEEANRIHLVATSDSEVTSHVENTFVHKLARTVRDLAGHANDLKHLMASHRHNSLYLHIFDEYLKKLY